MFTSLNRFSWLLFLQVDCNILKIQTKLNESSPEDYLSPPHTISNNKPVGGPYPALAGPDGSEPFLWLSVLHTRDERIWLGSVNKREKTNFMC